MLNNISRLYDISNKTQRFIIGLMSGTSLDGVDIALCQITGSGKHTKLVIKAFTTVEYTQEIVFKIKNVFSMHQVELAELAILNEELGILHGEIVSKQLGNWGVKSAEIDLIASHGQTIFHAPASFHQQMSRPNATLQIGDGDHIARVTGIITIADFRQRHLAAGGEGAPLVTYGDHLLFASKENHRILINIGGIANLTFLPKAASLQHVVSSDVGPGNTLMDAYVQHHFPGQRYDKNSMYAAEGNINPTLLDKLLSHEFLNLKMPKSTGPEAFNLDFVNTKIRECERQKNALDGIDENNIALQHHTASITFHCDILATLNMYTATCIANHVKACVEMCEDEHTSLKDIDVYLSGGGVHNAQLLKNIKTLLPTSTILTTDALGISPDAKEAALFALLANECVSGRHEFSQEHDKDLVQSKVPITSMGKICFPL